MSRPDQPPLPPDGTSGKGWAVLRVLSLRVTQCCLYSVLLVLLGLRVAGISLPNAT